MNQLLGQIASTTQAVVEEKGIFSSIGIDWTLLVIQTLAFLVLLWFLAKFVYPPLTKMLDKREEEIKRSSRAAMEAEKNAAESQAAVERLLKQARKEASEILSTASEESSKMTEAADKKSKERAERIVADARGQIEKDVVAAKKALYNETLELVAMATEKVTSKAIIDSVDKKIIASSLEEASK